MLKKNNFIFGFLLGLAATVVVYGLFWLLLKPIQAIFPHFIISQATMISAGLIANVIILANITRPPRNAYQTARGIMVQFILVAIYIVYRFYSDY